jgi:hypothetical protein
MKLSITSMRMESDHRSFTTMDGMSHAVAGPSTLRVEGILFDVEQEELDGFLRGSSLYRLVRVELNPATESPVKSEPMPVTTVKDDHPARGTW